MSGRPSCSHGVVWPEDFCEICLKEKFEQAKTLYLETLERAERAEKKLEAEKERVCRVDNEAMRLRRELAAIKEGLREAYPWSDKATPEEIVHMLRELTQTFEEHATRALIAAEQTYRDIRTERDIAEARNERLTREHEEEKKRLLAAWTSSRASDRRLLGRALEEIEDLLGDGLTEDNAPGLVKAIRASLHEEGR